MKTFKVAGTTVKNGVTKFRTAQDIAVRTKQFMADKQTDINLVDLPTAMDKVSAARYCLTHEKFTDLKCQLAINEALGEEKATTINVTKAVKATTEPAVEPVVKSNTTVELSYDIPELEQDDDYADIVANAFDNNEIFMEI